MEMMSLIIGLRQIKLEKLQRNFAGCDKLRKIHIFLVNRGLGFQQPWT